MNNNLQRISVSVDKEDYEKLKGFSKPGLSIGFLIREAIHDFLSKTKKINH
tara:strand:+ start:4765 stop:4917 length:153 start_codon:yes stop_codon:yes gene_type:complete